MSYELLLQIAFAQKPQADAAWEQYKKNVDPQEEDSVSVALFPLVYRRLNPIETVYKSVYRHTWCSNQLKLATLGEASTRLQAASIPFCLLGTAAVALTYYQDLGTRSMGDLEILVSAEELKQARELLQGLHVTVHGELFPEGRVDPLFKRFRFRQTIAEHAVLCPEDQLLHTLFRQQPHWIPDAITILRSTPSFQWDYFISQVDSLKFQWMIGQKILRLKGLVHIPFHLLDLHHPTKNEVRYAKLLEKKPWKWTPRLSFYWAAHLHNSSSQNIFVLLGTLPRFFKQSKQFSSWFDVFLFLGKKLYA